MLQPVLRDDQRRPDRLRGGVVLIDDRPPPVHHLLLDLDGARRGRMHRALQAGQVVLVADWLGKFQHAGEHHRHELAVGDAVPLDRVEAALCVELLHDDGRDACALNLHRPHRRRGVIQRGRADVDRLGIQPEADQARHQAGHLGRWQVRKLALDALRSAGGARRILQQVAFDLVADRRIRLIRNAFGVAVPAVQIVIGDDAQLGNGVLAEVLARLAQRRGADDRFGAAVVDDVGRLGRGQVGVDRHVVQTAAARRPHDGVVMLVVLHQNGDGVAFAKTVLAEEVGEAVGAGLEFGECQDRPRRMDDDGRLVGVGHCVFANLHVPTLRLQT